MNLGLPHSGLCKAAAEADGRPLLAAKRVAGAGGRQQGQEDVNHSAICHRA